MGIISLINKDVKAENETKKVIVALRVMYITVLIAFAIDILLAGTDTLRSCAMSVVIYASAMIILFISTYFCKTRTASVLFMLFLYFWIIKFIPIFGWSAGLQNYFIIILMVCFFGTYGKPVFKFITSGFVLVIRIIIIMLFGKVESLVAHSLLTDKLIQITNITAVFLAIIYISYVFSKSEKEGEEKLMKYNDQLKREANTDRLTGLFNRRRAVEYLQEMIAEQNGNPISVAMGDIDFFKRVNDSYGHDIGDIVLKEVAAMMTRMCAHDAFVARWGGEEFLLIYKDHNGDQAFVKLEELRRAIQHMVINTCGHEIKITMTFGLSEYDFEKDGETAIKEADERLYQGKANGRNQVVY